VVVVDREIEGISASSTGSVKSAVGRWVPRLESKHVIVAAATSLALPA
jgi:hypothetical protein